MTRHTHCASCFFYIFVQVLLEHRKIRRQLSLQEDCIYEITL